MDVFLVQILQRKVSCEIKDEEQNVLHNMQIKKLMNKLMELKLA